MTSHRFESTRIVFGEDAFLHLTSNLRLIGLFRPFVVTTRGRANELERMRLLLGSSLAGVFDGAAEHVPVAVTRLAEKALRKSNADGIVALGGGSAIGLAKALVLRTNLPLAAVPTTYSGSEMTAIYGETDETGKKTGKDQRVAPRIVIYDPLLTLDLPVETSAASGLNALAHSIEALYSPNANQFSEKYALESIPLLAESLPQIVTAPQDVAQRTNALKGAQLAGAALNSASMGLHHRICHVLGGSFGLPHAKTHAVMLRYVVAYNFNTAENAMRQVEEAMKAGNAITGVGKLCDILPVPRSLGAIGFHESDIGRAAEEIVTGSYANPRKATETDTVKILRAAFIGADPIPLSQ